MPRLMAVFLLATCVVLALARCGRHEPPPRTLPSAAEPDPLTVRLTRAEERISELEAEVTRLGLSNCELEEAMQAEGDRRADTDATSLVEDLDEGDIVARYQAAHRLARMGEAAVPHLLAAIEDDPTGRKAETAALVLAGMDDPRATSALIRVFRTSPRATARCAVLLAAARRGPPELQPLVLEGLQDEKAEVRMAAARAAGRLVLIDATPRLLDIASRAAPEERRVALSALSRIGAEAVKEAGRRFPGATPGERVTLLEAVEKAGGEEALVLARAALSDSSGAVRLAAAHVLFAHGSNEGRSVAEDIAHDSRDPRLQEAANRLLTGVTKEP